MELEIQQRDQLFFTIVDDDDDHILWAVLDFLVAICTWMWMHFESSVYVNWKFWVPNWNWKWHNRRGTKSSDKI